MTKMQSGERTTIKRSNYIGIAGSMVALLGLFLPYLPGVSFFCSLEGLPAQALAPILAFFLALAAVLYALGREVLPRLIILCLFFAVLVFPAYAVINCGLFPVLHLLRSGAWLLHLGLAAPVAEILLPMDWLTKSRGFALDNSFAR